MVFSAAADHGIPKCKRHLLIPIMRAHTCTAKCLVHVADAVAAGEMSHHISVAQPLHQAKQPRTAQSASRARRRETEAARVINRDRADLEWWRVNWPQVESDDALKDVSP